MNKNNLTFFLSLIIILTILTLFLPWVSSYQVNSFMYSKTPYVHNGFDTSFEILDIIFPSHLLIGLFIISAILSILRIEKIIKISNKIPITLDTIVLLAFSLEILTIYQDTYNSTILLGIFVAFILIFISLILKLRSNK